MSKKQKKKRKINLAQLVGGILGAILGYTLVSYLEGDIQMEMSWEATALLFLGICGGFLLHIIIHEAGHLVFGLASGYQFQSFRIMNFMWVKEEEKLRLKRYSLAGTGGQCLMSPPDLIDGKMPVVLYNLGGALMNLAVSGVCIFASFFLPDIWYLELMMITFAGVGIVSALLNGIPLNAGGVNNDGYNLLELLRNKKAVRAFWVQMKVVEFQSKDVRLKDMPEEWFEVPSDEEMKNSMVATCGVFYYNRLMDEQRLEEAEKWIQHLLHIESGIAGIYKHLMTCDLMYLEMLGQNRKEVLDDLYSKELKSFMKQMKQFPSVIRTEYVYALLVEQNEENARKKKEQFDKVGKTYPYKVDIQSERELMKLAEEKVEDKYHAEDI